MGRKWIGARGHLPANLRANLSVFRRAFVRFSPFKRIPESELSYLMTVPGEPGQKDVLDV